MFCKRLHPTRQAQLAHPRPAPSWTPAPRMQPRREQPSCQSSCNAPFLKSRLSSCRGIPATFRIPAGRSGGRSGPSCRQGKDTAQPGAGKQSLSCTGYSQKFILSRTSCRCPTLSTPRSTAQSSGLLSGLPSPSRQSGGRLIGPTW